VFTQALRLRPPREIRAPARVFRAPREAWLSACITVGKIEELPPMSVLIRYGLATILFGMAALGFILLR
jgi:hypothetical protein